MTTITRHTGAHIATSTLMAGGSVMAGVVMAAGDGDTAIFTSISCRRSRDLESITLKS